MKWKHPTATPTYNSWVAMRHRCRNPKHVAYSEYGGRGITVLDRWFDSYDEFYTDMGERPFGTTIDRIDTNGNYEPKNCRWVSRVEQNRNSRANRQIEFGGKRQTLSAWATDLGIDYDALRDRINRGIPLIRALTPGTLRNAARHGTRAKYNLGCRCDECKAAQRAHDQQRRSA